MIKLLNKNNPSNKEQIISIEVEDIDLLP